MALKNRLVPAFLLGIAAATLGPAACTAGSDSEVAAIGTEAGIDLAAMDTSADPGEDFYAYANGGWMAATEIPADRSNIGGFWIAGEQTENNLDALLAELDTAQPAADSDAGRVKAFYDAWRETATIDRLGMAPIRPDLERIAAVSDKTGLARALGASMRADADPLNYTDLHSENLFGVFVTQALAEREQMPYLLQGGLFQFFGNGVEIAL